MNSQITKTFIPLLLALCAGVLPAFNIAMAAPPSLKFIRTIDTDDLFGEDFFIAGNPDLSGVGFPPKANTLVLLDQPAGRASVILAAPPKNITDTVLRTPLVIPDSINTAFDSVSQRAKGQGQFRLFLFDADLGELIAVKAGSRNVMDSKNIRRFDAQKFGIGNPQGMTIDPTTGKLFVLDSAGPRIAAIQPKLRRNFTGAVVTPISLGGLTGKLRGIAFNPADSHLYILSTEQQALYKLSLDGELADTISLSGLKIDVPQGMVFAPSLDPTDHPSIFHLYLLSAKGLSGETTEWALR